MTYCLVHALCSWGLGPAAGVDVSLVPFPGFAAPASFPSPAALVAASSLAAPAAAKESTNYTLHIYIYSLNEIYYKPQVIFDVYFSQTGQHQHSQGHVLTLRCSWSWTWCWRIMFSCCLWNSFISNCFWICCCFWMRSNSCCSCRSHTLGSEPRDGILASVRRSSGDTGSRANGTSGLMSTENMAEERLRTVRGMLSEILQLPQHAPYSF